MKKLDEKVLALSSIWASPKWNNSRQPKTAADVYRRSKPKKEGEIGTIDGDLSTMVGSFCLDGFSSAKGTSMVVFKLNATQKKQAVAEIRRMEKFLQEHSFLKGDKLTVTLPGEADGEASNEKLEIPTDAALEAFRAIWMPKGKPVTPTYGCNSGNRRMFAVPFINAGLALRKKKVIKDYPCTLVNYASEADRILDNAKLNEDHKVGMRDLSNKNRIGTAVQLYAQGAKQSDYRKVWKVGVAQFLWEVAVLDSHFPTVKLAEKIADGDIKVTSGHKEDLRKLRKLIEKTEAGAKISTASGRRKRAKDPTIVKQVEDFFADVKANATGRVRAASRKDMDEMAGRSKVGLVSDVLNAAKDDNLAVLGTLNDHADEINAAIEAIKAGVKLAPALFVLDPETGEQLAPDAVTQDQLTELYRELLTLRKKKGRRARA